MKINQDDIKILSYIRNNARESIVQISKQTNIPQSTVYQKLQQYQQYLIKKHTCLFDFKKLGFPTRAHIAIKVNKSDRMNLLEFIQGKPNINSAYKVNHDFDFMLECIFKNYEELKLFVEDLEEKFDIGRKQVHQLHECIKKETFLTKEGHLSRADLI